MPSTAATAVAGAPPSARVAPGVGQGAGTGSAGMKPSLAARRGAAVPLGARQRRLSKLRQCGQSGVQLALSASQASQI